MNLKRKEMIQMNKRPPKPQIKKGTTKRLLRYLGKKYTASFIFVIICIILSSVASIAGSLFLQTLIDDHITPLLSTPEPVFTGLLGAIGTMALIYLIGVITGYLYNRIMATISQGVLRDIRDEMFVKMEKLPIKYFDTNSHGDIMSHYTNDTDTLRHMLGKGLPQIISSVFSIIATLCSMIYLSWELTILVLIFTYFTLFATKKIAKKSSKYFIGQQHSLGKVNGYVKEMLIACEKWAKDMGCTEFAVTANWEISIV